MSERPSEPAAGASGLREVGPPAPSLEGEAMRRRIGERLFGALAEPLRIGRFRVQRSLGQGGMGVVYAAEDDTLGRPVALKVIRPDTGGSRPRERQRLLEEARALAKLSHPNVISIYEVGEHGDEIFIAMEYVPGCTLQRWLETPRTRAEIVAQFVAAGRGLAAAHAVGLVHRDFKPGNVLIGEDGRARILDFGLARGPRVRSLQEAAISEPDSTPISELPVPATERQAGTPGYMSPEQVLGQGCDARSDQFSFCVTLHEALYGRRPFRKDVVAALVRQDVLRPPSSGTRGRVPGWLRRALTRGLAFAPEARFASMDALLVALERGSRARTRWLWAGAAGLAVAAGFIGVELREQGKEQCPAAAQGLLETWSPARREVVRRAFEATQPVEQAGQAWGTVARAIDEYADEWSRASRAACAEDRRGGDAMGAVSARHLCLEERRRDLDNVLELIERRDPGMADGVRELMARLKPIERCEKFDLVAERRAMDRASEVAYSELSQARMLSIGGRTEEAQRRIAALLVDAPSLGERRLEAELLLLRGTIEGRIDKDAAAAEGSLLAALAITMNEGASATTPEILNELAFLAADLSENAEQARMWLRLTRGAKADGLLKAKLLDTESYIELLADNVDRVVELRSEAFALRRRWLPPGHPDLARAQMGVANALAERGQPEVARDGLVPLRFEQKRLLGESHPALLDIELSLAQVHLELGEFEEAAALLKGLRTETARLFGNSSGRVAMVDVSLARIEASRDPAAAIGRLRGVLAVVGRYAPAGNLVRVDALWQLADLLLATQQAEAALDVNRELLALHDRGATIPIDSVLVNIGDYLCELGRCGEAVVPYTRLLSLSGTGTAPGADGLPLQGLGRVYLSQGQPRLAVGWLEQARDIFIRTPRPTPHMLEQTTRMLAKCLTLLGEPRRAREMLAEADRLKAELEPGN